MNHRTLILTALVASLQGACGKSRGAIQEATAHRLAERATEEGLIEQEVDLDGDGVTDIRNYLRERPGGRRILVRKEIDLNRDGATDVVSYFDEDGNLEREEMDSDYDGRFDWTDHYKDGVRVMSEYDTDYDGTPNMFKYYIEGDDGMVYLDRKERDENGDGRIDLWERFSPEGEVIRAGRDNDGDGKVDERLE